MPFGKVNRVFDAANDTTGAPDTGALLAANVRRLRIARRLSLSELARATRIGKATLSEIESGRANPTVGTLTLLAQALGVRIAELVDEPPLGEIRIVRAASRRPADDRFRERAVDRFATGAHVEVQELSLPARHVHEREASPAGAREELFVLQGTLIAGPVERISELSAGDYASFPADVPRRLEAGRHPARVLLLAHATL